MADALIGLLNNVVDETSFIAFVAALAEDWEQEQREMKLSPSSLYGSGPHGWENGTIGTFLEAAASCASAGRHLGGSDLKSTEEVWRRAAEIVYMGKIYE